MGDAARDLHYTDFDTLRQDAGSVAEYEQEFDRLIRDTPQYYSLEDQKNKKFIRGLRSEIHEALIPLSIVSYRNAVQKAMLMEREESDVRAASYQSQDSKRGFGAQGQA